MQCPVWRLAADHHVLEVAICTLFAYGSNVPHEGFVVDLGTRLGDQKLQISA